MADNQLIIDQQQGAAAPDPSLLPATNYIAPDPAVPVGPDPSLLPPGAELTPGARTATQAVPTPTADPVNLPTEALKRVATTKPLDMQQAAALHAIPVGPPTGGGMVEQGRNVSSTTSKTRLTDDAKTAALAARDSKRREAQAVYDSGEEVTKAVAEVTAHHSEVASQLQRQQDEMQALVEKGDREIEQQTTNLQKAREEARKAAASINPNRLLGGVGGAVRILGTMMGMVGQVSQFAATGEVRRNAAAEVLRQRLAQDFEQQMAMLGAKQTEQTFERDLLTAIRQNVTDQRNAKGLYIAAMKEVAAEKLLGLQSNVTNKSQQAETAKLAQGLYAEADAEYAAIIGREVDSKNTTVSRNMVRQAATQATALQKAVENAELMGRYNKSIGGPSAPEESRRVKAIEDVNERYVKPLQLIDQLDEKLGELGRLMRLGPGEDSQEVRQLQKLIVESIGRAASGAAIGDKEWENFRAQALGPNDTWSSPEQLRRAMATYRRAVAANAHSMLASSVADPEMLPGQFEQATRGLTPAMREAITTGVYLDPEQVRKRHGFRKAGE